MYALRTSRDVRRLPHDHSGGAAGERAGRGRGRGEESLKEGWVGKKGMEGERIGQ